MRTPKFENFTLNKVKRPNGLGLNVDFKVNEVFGTEICQEGFSVSSDKAVHPDLLSKLNSLIPIMATLYEWDANEMNARITIKGISLNGEEEKRSCVISGTFEISNGMIVAINSCRLLLNSDTFGFESKLRDIIKEIENEVYLFLFKDKKAQLEMFDEFGEPCGVAE